MRLKVLFHQEMHFAIRFRVLNRFVEGFQTYPESRRQLPELQERHIAQFLPLGFTQPARLLIESVARFVHVPHPVDRYEQRHDVVGWQGSRVKLLLVAECLTLAAECRCCCRREYRCRY